MGNKCSTGSNPNTQRESFNSVVFGASKKKSVNQPGEFDDNRMRSESTLNRHVVNPDILVHTVITGDLDYNHSAAMKTPLGDCTDESLVAELARRQLSIHTIPDGSVLPELTKEVLKVALGRVTDEQVFAEAKRRNLDIVDKIDDSLVRQTYDFGSLLGVGASGEVILVTHKKTRAKYACKIVKKDASMNDAQSMSTEIEIMKRIRHKNVVSMFELFESPKCLWIILEVVSGGDLMQYIAKTDLNDFHEDLCGRFTGQILEGVHYLHSLGVIHRDLKLDNILLSEPGPRATIKLADFGLSALVRLSSKGYDPGESSKRKKFHGLEDMWGTKEYFAPELIQKAYGPQADVWAVGCLLYEILCGHQAFPIRRDDTEEKFFGRISSGDYDFKMPAWKLITSDAKDLVVKLLTVDPSKRLTATEATKHKWVVAKDRKTTPLVDAYTHLKYRQQEKLKKKHKKH